MLMVGWIARYCARSVGSHPFPFPQQVLKRCKSNLTGCDTNETNFQKLTHVDNASPSVQHPCAVGNDLDSKCTSTVRDAQDSPKLQEAFSIVETLTPEELVKLAEKVTLVQKMLPMVPPYTPKNVEGAFTIYDKGFVKEAPEFDFWVDTVRSYKLVWSNGEEMDLKMVHRTDFIVAGSMMCEVQGLKIGPLLITAAFPESNRLPDSSSVEDLEGGIEALVEICKQHGVSFQDAGEFISFIDWLMQVVMEGSTQFLYHTVNDGPLTDAYDNLFK